MRYGIFRLSKNASQNFVRKDETTSNSFFAPTCAKRKIQIGLQVWNLFAEGGQIMRAADLLCPSRKRGLLCQNAPKEYFDRLKNTVPLMRYGIFYISRM